MKKGSSKIKEFINKKNANKSFCKFFEIDYEENGKNIIVSKNYPDIKLLEGAIFNAFDENEINKGLFKMIFSGEENYFKNKLDSFDLEIVHEYIEYDCLGDITFFNSKDKEKVVEHTGAFKFLYNRIPFQISDLGMVALSTHSYYNRD